MRAARRVAIASAALAAATLARPRLQSWGATPDEIRSPLPGDAVLERASLTATRAITIRAASRAVWPWIAQIGQGRGGFYSYDALENRVGCDIHSASRIVEAWQHPAVGDAVHLAPTVALRIVDVEPDRWLVLGDGLPEGGAPPAFEFTWAFVLRERSDGATRLLVRERYRYASWWAAPAVEAIQAASLVMSRRMLLGIRARAEAASG